jgi:hypothetical protein
MNSGLNEAVLLTDLGQLYHFPGGKVRELKTLEHASIKGNVQSYWGIFEQHSLIWATHIHDIYALGIGGVKSLGCARNDFL